MILKINSYFLKDDSIVYLKITEENREKLESAAKL